MKDSECVTNIYSSAYKWEVVILKECRNKETASLGSTEIWIWGPRQDSKKEKDMSVEHGDDEQGKSKAQIPSYTKLTKKHLGYVF